MKRLPILSALAFCATFFASSASAAPVSQNDAKQAVAAWLATTSVPCAGDIQSIRPKDVVSYRDDEGEVLFHMVSLERGGFVVTTADDTLSPILLYSTTGGLPDENPDNPFWMLATQVVLGRKVAVNDLDENGRNAEWVALLDVDLAKLDAADPRDGVDDYVVAPLLKNAAAQILQSDCDSANYLNKVWQNTYKATYKYKNILSRYSEEKAEEPWPWGCSTVALAKIIAYHGERMGDTSYDWETIAKNRYSLTELALLDKISKGLNTQYYLEPETGEKTGGGSLSSGVGDLSYIDENGALTTENLSAPGAVNALKKTFGYANAEDHYVETGLDPQWLDIVLRSNLNAGLPILVSGGGHIFVADGYGYVGKTPYFHLDMGWFGTSQQGNVRDYWWNLSSSIVPPGTYKDFSAPFFYETVYNIHPTKTFDKLVTGRVTMMGAGVGAEVKITLPNGETATQTTEDGIYVFFISGKVSGKATITASSTADANVGSVLGALGISSALVQAGVQTAIKPATVTLTLTGESNYCCDLALETPAGSSTTPSSGTTSFSVKINANGGTGSAKSVSVMVGTTVASLPKPTRKGYVFVGWFTAKSGGSNVSASTTISKNMTLYAHWAKPTYKVAFYANGGKGKMAVQTMKYGKTTKLKANKFKRKGYTFKGWATSKAKAKKGEVKYKDKAKVKNLLTNGKTVKLYAVWKKK